MKLKTVRVRRSRPSALAMALALMLTMLCVYLASLPSPVGAQQALAAAPAEGDVHLAGLETTFHCEGRYAARLDAALAAARCSQSGGAGLVLLQEDQYAVIAHAGGENSENAFTRSAPGLTLRLSGSSGDVQAISDAAAFLQALHTETAALAGALEKGNTNAAAIASLMDVYRTRAERAMQALIALPAGSPVTSALVNRLENARVYLECVQLQPTTAHLRHLHAAACAEWISLLEELGSMAQQQAPIP